MDTGIQTNNEKQNVMYNPKWSTMHKICSQFKYADTNLWRNLYLNDVRVFEHWMEGLLHILITVGNIE